MRVLFAATADRRRRLAEVVRWWDRGTERATLLLSDGTSGYLDAVAPAAPDLAVVGGVPVRQNRAGTVVHLVAQEDPDLTADALAALARRGPATVVVATGAVGTHDGGAGLLSALAAAAGGSGSDPVGLLGAAREAVSGMRLVAAVEDAVPLLGLGGMSARLRERGVEPGRAQRVEREIGEFAHAMAAAAGALDAANRSLLGGSPKRVSAYALPGAGSGGGTAHAVGLLGGRLLPALGVVADAVGAADAIGQADLVVGVVGPLDARELGDGVTAALARRAAPWAVPLIVFSEDDVAGRREWAAAGVAGVYEWGPDPAARVARVARTWDLA